MNNVTKNRFKRFGSRVSSLLGLYMRPQTRPSLIHEFVGRLVPHDLGVALRRIGGSSDGGYLIPDDLAEIEYCFSPGVGETAVFEKALYDMGIRSFLTDYSVAGPPASLPDCDFQKKFVGAVNSENVVTLDHWVSEKCPDQKCPDQKCPDQKCPDRGSGDLILQMDIEGAEFETILATSPETLSRFRIIVLELHKLNHLNNRLFFGFVDAAIRKILDRFEVAHLHANNGAGLTRIAGIDIPRVVEIVFLRKDRVTEKSPILQLPNPLDLPNVPDQAELVLPDYWWKDGALERAA